MGEEEFDRTAVELKVMRSVRRAASALRKASLSAKKIPNDAVSSLAESMMNDSTRYFELLASIERAVGHTLVPFDMGEET